MRALLFIKQQTIVCPGADPETFTGGIIFFVKYKFFANVFVRFTFLVE